MNEHLERYKLIFEHFKLMELRYHTWMNYYSLFNGALLVLFIKGVIVSWTLAGAYAVWSVCLNLERGNLCLLIVLTVILIVSLWVGFRYTKKESNVDGFALNRVSSSDETLGNTSIRNQVAHVLNIVARLLECYIR